MVGNSLGGRVAIEVGLRFPSRTGRLGLLAPSLAWLRGRPFAPLLRLVRPQLGLLPADAARADRVDRATAGPGRGRGLDRGRRRRVPAFLPDAAGTSRVLRGGAQHLPRGAVGPARPVDAVAEPDGSEPVRLGSPRSARADRLRTARPRGVAGLDPSGAGLRARPATRGRRWRPIGRCCSSSPPERRAQSSTQVSLPPPLRDELTIISPSSNDTRDSPPGASCDLVGVERERPQVDVAGDEPALDHGRMTGERHDRLDDVALRMALQLARALAQAPPRRPGIRSSRRCRRGRGAA